MSKISEQKALKAYPIDIIPDDDTMGFTSSDRNEIIRLGYQQGYDQAMQDLLKDANQYMYLSDEIGYAYACGCKKTMQDFLEKACEWLEKELLVSDIEHQKYWLMTEENKSNFIEGFKNYMQDEM